MLICKSCLVECYFLRCNRLLDCFFAAVGFVLFAIMRNIYFLIFKADKRSMLIILVRVRSFCILIFVAVILDVKRELFLALIFMLCRCGHHNIFQHKLVIVGVVQLVLNHCWCGSHWLYLHFHNVLHRDPHILSINFDFRPVFAWIWTVPLLGLVIAAVVATRTAN